MFGRERRGVVGSLGNLEITSPLVYGDGVLYYGTARESVALNALPTSGGASAVLAQIRAEDLWLDDDRLLVPGGPSNNQLFAVPITGGPPQLVVDGSAPSDAHSASLHAVNATDDRCRQSARQSQQSRLAGRGGSATRCVRAWGRRGALASGTDRLAPAGGGFV